MFSRWPTVSSVLSRLNQCPTVAREAAKRARDTSAPSSKVKALSNTYSWVENPITSCTECTAIWLHSEIIFFYDLYRKQERGAAPIWREALLQIWEASVMANHLSFRRVCENKIFCFLQQRFSTAILIIGVRDATELKTITAQVCETDIPGFLFSAIKSVLNRMPKSFLQLVFAKTSTMMKQICFSHVIKLKHIH